MLNYFLKKNQIIKLDLLQLVFSHENIKKTEIMESLQINRSTLERTISEINLEIHEEINNEYGIDSSLHKTYHLTAKSQENYNFLYHSLKLNYLKSSVTFVILKELLTGTSNKINSLALQLAISTSYCYKVVRDLKNYLEEFDIQLSIHNKNSGIQLLGDEASIRMFIYVFITESFQNLEWPFQKITISEIKHLLDEETVNHLSALSDVTKTHLYYAVAIFQSRIKNRLVIDLTDRTELRELLILCDSTPPLFNRTFQNYDFLLHLAPETQLDEKLFFNFFVYTFFPTQENLETRQFVAQNWFSTPSSLQDYATIFADEVISEWQLSPKPLTRQNIISFCMYTLVLAMLFNPNVYQKIKGSFTPIRFKLEKLHKKRVVREYTVFIKKFLDRHPSPYTDLIQKEGNLDYFIGQVCILHGLLTQHQLKIFIQFERNITASLLIHTKIMQVFSTDTIKIVDTFDEADCIITNHLILNSPKKNIIFNEIFDIDEWRHLFESLQKLLWEINFDPYN